MTDSQIGYVHSTESFGSVDGPGIRFVVFMQGCRMRCEFCHNPDTWNMGGGTPYAPQELLDQALKYKNYWGEEGGITVSGGEPLIHIDFLIEFFKLAKEAGVSVSLDTCGQPFTYDEPFFSRFEELMKYTDLVLMDIKHIDNEIHKKYTMHSNTSILDMANYLSKIGKPMWLRHVLVPERSDFDEHLERLSEFIEQLDSVEKVEILPYHRLGVYKYEELGIPYKLKDIDPPTAERVENANRILKTHKYQTQN
ncbi:pyruvate formate lyase activating enzyme [Alkalibacterium putridalgicola]|uniref:Pyruvate formate-lyase-activating enzyme n=1 Tax=Alkalibacterium putridalgicola TaxID=426703 RepID=A0A1H7X4F1_9LACT|nr:pyruvate formate-lyase-activating protein [Alkalibacterium putridalgicola]GEK90273.1 pyruvate formate-lyase-activating enzyme [Alkalibacterium putridalgicola]SEM28740.1 pyruvate formate lyase activating enzyme [Alkalibacterium putridalgicola]